jgi:integration host factor subunit beta
MTRNELAATLAQRFPSLAQADIAECVRLLLGAMADAVAAGQRTEIRGFGDFWLHFRPPRNSRNPGTKKSTPTNPRAPRRG